jgi:glyoxylase-like metal-dependent hydrolase (beta-lactamase superfamily II)
MPTSVNPISLPMPLGMGAVNVYLLRAGDAFVLVDTGAPNARGRLPKILESLGCLPGKLKLIVITHGDFDHTGTAAYLRRAFGSRIGMHADDAPMAERGDMFVNRKKPNALLRILVPRLIGFGKAQRFAPDVLLTEGTTLAEYGLDARVVAIPGHSKGSIAILTAERDLLCGDLYESIRQPTRNSLIDDDAAALASDARVRSMGIRIVYPGHGAPFSPDQLAGTAI